MNERNMDEVVDAWIMRFTFKSGDPEYEQSGWATTQLLDWTMDGESERLWEFINVAYKRDLTDKLVAVLAAGPVEDLLGKFGAAYIDRVEELARTDSRFNSLLGGVWRNTMPDDVWERVQAARNEVW